MALLAQAPNLGVCASFALFTPVGALANTGGLTGIVGNIGTNSGAVSGYSAANVVGDVHTPDSETAQAALDVQAAYDHLVKLACSTGTSLAPAMGAGQTITSSIYCFGGAASVGGDFILDGQNQTNPLFIFKVNGALSVGAASRILLINGASPNSVYWQVNGAATFAANSSFVGTIIANGAVGFGDGASLQGRGLSTTGAISTYNNQIIMPTGTPLPVELLAFTAQAKGGTAVALAWSTASEKNSARFEVERSTNGTTFNQIGTVPAAGNSSAQHSYSLTDETLLAKETLLYYRLRQVDADGNFAYSPLRTVLRTLTAESQLVAYPNPAHGHVYVQLVGQQVLEPLQLLDATGRVVQAHSTLGADGALPLTGLPAGMYMLRCGPLAQRLTVE